MTFAPVLFSENSRLTLDKIPPFANNPPVTVPESGYCNASRSGCGGSADNRRGSSWAEGFRLRRYLYLYLYLCARYLCGRFVIEE
jgi:hypothetical protein